MSIRRRSEFAILALLAMPASDALAAPPVPSGDVAQDALAKDRERFKVGMDRYKAGKITEAVETWEPIYRDLGRADGYRLAYNLGLAYAELGDEARASERLRSFLDEIDARRARGEHFEPLVMKEEAAARAHLGDLAVDARAPSPSGETIETSPPPAPPAPPLPPASALAPVPAPAPALAPAPVSTHPFPPALFYASGGLALAAGVAAIALEANANSLRNRFVAEHDSTGVISQQDRDSFDSARSWSYAAVGGAIGCSGITAGLVTWYLLGTARHELPVAPVVGAGRAGGSLGLRAAF